MEVSTGSGPRACRSCAVSKAKCFFPSHGELPNGKCRREIRCNRLGKECTTQVPGLRKGRPRPGLPSPDTTDEITLLQSSTPLPLPFLNGHPTNRASSLFSGPAAFLGPTSFSAVFQENRTDLDQVNSSNPMVSNSHSNTSMDLVNFGAKILAQIPEEAMCKVLYSRHVNPNDGWIRLAGIHLTESIFNSFGTQLRLRRNQELQLIASHICGNTTSIPHDEVDPVKWFGSFSGENLRWESLGILFTYWSFGAISSREDDPMFISSGGDRTSRRQLMVQLKECASSCIALCAYLDIANPFVVYLLYKHSLLESIISGDASIMYWRQHGDLVSMTTALGLHRDVSSPSSTPSVASEMRRRIYAAVFNIDKCTATFMGRPPMLGSRYSSTPLPLDLSDEDLLAGEPALSQIIASLDANGWNTNGEIYSTTILRARTMFAFIRDEILALALGTVVGDIATQIDELKKRSNATYAQLPAVIVYHSSDLANPQISSRVLYSRFLTRFEHLQGIFILERILVKRNHVNTQNLIDISIEMLAMTAGIWKYRDRLMDLHSDFEWLIMYHAVPAAGILSIELLKHSHPVPSSSPQPTLSISETVQNLSLLIGFLDWVDPAAPGSELRHRIRDIIRRILAQVLDPPTRPLDMDEGIGGVVWDLGLDMEFSLAEFDEYANFDLLDTFDWVGGGWEGED